MQTECIADQLEFEGFDGHRVVAAFDGGAVTSDAGVVLPREADRAIGLIDRVAACFWDGHDPNGVVHPVRALVGQRIVAIALGYEDVNDHDRLRFDPVLALLSDRLQPKRKDCAPLAGKSTVNRLEHAPRGDDDRYHKIGHDPTALEDVFVEVFLDAHAKAPREIVIDLDATDDPFARASRGPVLPRLLRLLLLSAAVRVLRPAAVDGEAAPLQHRRLGGGGGGGGADRQTHPDALAAGEGSPPGRLRLRPGRADGLVRSQSGRLPLRAGAQFSAARQTGGGLGLG